MAIDIARQRYVSAFGGTALAWRLAAHAQQSAVRWIGWITQYAQDPLFQSQSRSMPNARRETGARRLQTPLDFLPAIAGLGDSKSALDFFGRHSLNVSSAH